MTVHAKHTDIVLIHGKSPKGAELIAAKWADNRKVPQVGFAPNWDKHGRAAPFKRNDAMLDLLPIGVIVFPGTGIRAHRRSAASRPAGQRAVSRQGQPRCGGRCGWRAG